MEVTEIIIHKADQPNGLDSLLDADGLAGEDLTEIDFLVIEADAAHVVMPPCREAADRSLPGIAFALTGPDQISDRAACPSDKAAISTRSLPAFRSKRPLLLHFPN